jgi:hypothetical protein
MPVTLCIRAARPPALYVDVTGETTGSMNHGAVSAARAVNLINHLRLGDRDSPLRRDQRRPGLVPGCPGALNAGAKTSGHGPARERLRKLQEDGARIADQGQCAVFPGVGGVHVDSDELHPLILKL